MFIQLFFVSGILWAVQSMSVGHFLGAAFTGRVILPNLKDRKPDGGVWLEIYSQTTALFVPERLWLAYDGTAEFSKALLERTTKSVDFDLAKKPIEKYLKGPFALRLLDIPNLNVFFTAGNILPFSINKWIDVSPLESLAGQRLSTDEPVEVAIYPDDYSYDAQTHTLFITSEPTMITGEQVHLVKIIEPIQMNMEVSSVKMGAIQSDMFLAKRYNRHSKAFDLDDLKVMFLRNDNRLKTEQKINFTNIELSELNRYGWYLYGEYNSQGVFEVRAVESRRATTLRAPDRAIERIPWSCGSNPCQSDGVEQFIRHGNFRNERNMKGKVTLTKLGDLEKDFKIGDTGLLMHIFGGYARYDGTKRGFSLPFAGQLNTGHFSYGQYTIKTCKFTNEPRIDIEYFQIYAHNRRTIISGSTKYHTFAGSTVRGWQYLTTFSDSLFKMPLFEHRFSFGGAMDISVMDSIRLELAVMAARFRIGDGLGATFVTATSSCVQDSNQALYDGLWVIRHRILDNKAAVKFLKDPKNRYSEDVKSFMKLNSFYFRFVLRFVKLSRFRTDWSPHEEKAIRANKYNTMPIFGVNPTDLLKAFASGEFVVPRWLYDNLSVFMSQRGADSLILHSAQIGGEAPEIYPTAPGFDG